MSKSNRNRVKCSRPRGQNKCADAALSVNFAGSMTDSACSTYDSARMQALHSNADDSKGLCRPVCNQEHSGRAFNLSKDTTQCRLAKAARTQLHSPDRKTDLRNASYDSFYNLMQIPAEKSDRQHNPTFDEPNNRLTRAEKLKHFKQWSQNEDQMNMERELILQRLREKQHLLACEARRQAQMKSEDRNTKQLARTRDPTHQNQECPGKAGRRLNTDRDLMHRQSNRFTPKEQRARSCSAPNHDEIFQYLVQRMARDCPQPAQPAHIEPSRSISPREARYFETPIKQATRRSPRRRGDNLVDSNSAQPVVSPADTSGTLTAATTTRRMPTLKTNPRNLSKTPQGSPSRSSPKTPKSLADLLAGQQETQPKLNDFPDYRLQWETGYEPTPPETTSNMPYALEAFTNLVNKTAPNANATSNQTVLREVPSLSHTQNSARNTLGQQESVDSMGEEVIVNRMPMFPISDKESPGPDANNEAVQKETQGIYHFLDQKQGTSLRRSPGPAPQLPNQHKPYPSNISWPAETRFNGTQATEPPARPYIDGTQYVFDDMDISIQAFPCRLPYALPNEEQSWHIPPDDFTCIDHTNASRQLSCPISTNCDSRNNEPESTQYLELPPSLKVPFYVPHICRPYQQPKATPHRSPEEASQWQNVNQTSGQICDASTFGPPDLCSTTKFENMAFGVKDFFGTPHIETLNDVPAFARESANANARRCGHVEFDRSDKRQPQQSPCRALRQAELEILVDDTNLIQETLDGQQNFNNYSFSKQNSRGDILSENTFDAMTLLEAFSRRIDKERAEIKQILKEVSTSEQIKELINEHFGHQNATDLNRAIKSFLLCEQLKDHDEMEQAKSSFFEAEVQKWVTPWPAGRNMKLIAYIGRTGLPTKSKDGTN